MHTIHADVEIPDELYERCVAKARRVGTSVERLVSQLLQGLVERLDEEQHDEDDHPIFIE